MKRYLFAALALCSTAASAQLSPVHLQAATEVHDAVQAVPVDAAVPDYVAFLPTVPGAFNPAVTQDTIKSTICVHGWTKTVRPPTSYTNKVKYALMDAAGIPRSQSRFIELDHDASLEDSGDPGYLLGPDGFPLNLWLQNYRGPRCSHFCADDKDQIENKEKELVCKGAITLDVARQELTKDWIDAYRRRIGPLQ
jgi:hypothetical protein